MNAQTPITLTLTIEEIMRLPGEAVLVLLDKAGGSDELLNAARDHECRKDHGKGRWLVLNQIRNQLRASIKAPTA